MSVYKQDMVSEDQYIRKTVGVDYIVNGGSIHDALIVLTLAVLYIYMLLVSLLVLF
jgi:gamma-glutamyltranspeptidase